MTTCTEPLPAFTIRELGYSRPEGVPCGFQKPCYMHPEEAKK